jgi:hypothetical protein
MLISYLSLGMSVYEQIASRTRGRRQRKTLNDQTLDEQGEDIRHLEPDADNGDDDDRSSIVLQVGQIFVLCTLFKHSMCQMTSRTSSPKYEQCF